MTVSKSRWVAQVNGGDTGWIDQSHAGTSGNVWYRVKAGVVYIEANVSFASLADGAGFTILTGGNVLPTAYRPGHSLNMGIPRLNAGTQQGTVTAPTDGTLSVTNFSGAAVTSAQFRYSYPLG